MARTYDFSKIKLLGIDGNAGVIDRKNGGEDIYKTIGNIIYRSAKTLDLVDVAREIWAGKSVFLKTNEAKEIRSLITDEKSGLFSFVRKAVGEYMDEIEKQSEKSEDK